VFNSNTNCQHGEVSRMDLIPVVGAFPKSELVAGNSCVVGDIVSEVGVNRPGWNHRSVLGAAT
jgi:hypothetical protein